MRSISLILLLLSSLAFSKDVLMLGDSQMVGPMGYKLHKLLIENQNINSVIQYSHSSSAPIHWLSTKQYKLTGGISHKYSYKFEKIFSLNHPNPPHWRVPYMASKLSKVMDLIFLHENWQTMQNTFNFDLAIVALSGNDLRAIFNNGKTNQTSYKIRKAYLEEYVQVIESNFKECVWVLAPRGSRKNDVDLNNLYKLYKSVLDRSICTVVESKEFNADMCDGIHFSCSKGRATAYQWANKIYNSIEL